MKTIKQLYLDAADHIEKVGFHQGQFYRQDPDYQAIPGVPLPVETFPCCIRGALSVVASVEGESWYIPGYLEPLKSFLSLQAMGFGEPIAAWNDAIERTQEEAVAALRGAAATIPDPIPEEPCPSST